MQPVRIACLVLTVLLALSACSWFRAKPAPASDPTPGSVAAATAESPGTEPAIAPVAGEPAQGPVAVAIDFLLMHQRLGNSGLPQRSNMAAYDVFLCPSLAQAMRTAQMRQQQIKAEYPDRKPPLAEGDLFSSLFEGPDEFAAGDADVQGDQARIPVAMSSGSGKDGRRWIDTLHLRLDDGLWCLSDVEYGGDWASANKDRLSTVLALP